MKNTRIGLNLSTKEINTLKALDSKRNGAYFRIQYYTDCNTKVSAAFKGNNVTKLTTISVRKGIDYSKMKSVVAKRSSPNYVPSNNQPWFHHIDKMLLKHNTKEQYYVALYPNYGKPTTMYLLNGMPISKQELQEKGVMQPSFWKQQSEKPEMMTLGLDKIVNVY